MTGWRLGYIGAPKWVADACVKLQGQFTSGTCGITQKAAEAAVLADPSVTNNMREAFRRRRDLVLELMGNIEGIKLNHPEGAFYVFPDIAYYLGKSNGSEKIATADDLAMYLLNDAHVAVVTGAAFGDPNCIRISYATDEETLREAIRRIEASLSKLA